VQLPILGVFSFEPAAGMWLAGVHISTAAAVVGRSVVEVKATAAVAVVSESVVDVVDTVARSVVGKSVVDIMLCVVLDAGTWSGATLGPVAVLELMLAESDVEAVNDDSTAAAVIGKIVVDVKDTGSEVTLWPAAALELMLAESDMKFVPGEISA